MSLNRVWRNGDVIDVMFPFAIRKVVADGRVRETRGRVAVERGPMVFCAEWPETSDRRALALLLDTTTALSADVDKELMGGVTVIGAAAKGIAMPAAPFKPITLIPYPLWANRGAGEISVWLSTKKSTGRRYRPGRRTDFYVNPNYASDGWRYLEAAPLDQSLGAKWGCFRTPIAGARGTAVGTGRQNTADILAACADRGMVVDWCASYSLSGIGGWFLPSRERVWR